MNCAGSRKLFALQAIQDSHFWDNKNGGYFLTADDAEQLLAREKPAYDGAEPSGNAVAAHNLLRLAEWTMNASYRQRAQHCFKAFASELKQRPTSMPRLLSALDFFLDRPKEIAIVKASTGDTAEPFLEQLRRHFLPNRVLTIVTQGDELATHQQVVPWLEAKRQSKAKVTAYVCEQHICSLPTADPGIFAKQLAVTMPLSCRPLTAVRVVPALCRMNTKGFRATLRRVGLPELPAGAGSWSSPRAGQDERIVFLEGLVRLGETVFIAGRSLAADGQYRYAIADTQVQFLQGFPPEKEPEPAGPGSYTGTASPAFLRPAQSGPAASREILCAGLLGHRPQAGRSG